MTNGVYTLLPGTVASTTVLHGRGIALLDVVGDGQPELLVSDGPENTHTPWDGVTPLLRPLLVMKYDSVKGLIGVPLLDPAGDPVLSGAVNEFLIADFTGTGRLSFIGASTGPEVLTSTATAGSDEFVLAQLQLVTPDGAGRSTVTIASADYGNHGYAANFPEPGFGFWHSAASGDFDGDGTVDIIAVNLQAGLTSTDYRNNYLSTAAFLNDGHGKFTFAKDFLPQSFYQYEHAPWFRSTPPSVLAAGDLDGDGRPDMVLGSIAYVGVGDDPLYAELPRANHVYFNTGTGFEDPASVELPFPDASEFAAHGVDIDNVYVDRARIADFNNDGLQDISFILAPRVSTPGDIPVFAQLWLQNPDHTFRDAPIWPGHKLPIPGGAIDAVDVNGDGLLDLVSNTMSLPYLKDAGSNVWINTGGDNFESLASLAPDVIPDTGRGVTSWWFTNLDDSGPAELVVANPNKDYTASSLAVYSLKPAAIQSIAGRATKGTIFADRITGSSSADKINGGLGHDRIASGNGEDMVNGGFGNDTINGGAGNDQLNGGGGNDFLDGGSGADRMAGGAGNDTYNVDRAGDVIVEASGQGTDTVRSSFSVALLANFENLVLTGSADIRAVGNDLDNKITGNSGANRLVGGDGADTIKGEAGNDILIGGEGKDVMTGGDGLDVFVFNALLAPTNFDKIADFSHAEGDQIQLKGAVFKAFGYTGTLHADDFHAAAGATQAHDATDRLVYNTSTGVLYYDADGLGGASAVRIALLGTSTHPALVYGDFQIIA